MKTPAQRILWFRQCLKDFHRTRSEEWANCITHLAGIVFGIVALTMMCVFSSQYQTARTITSCAIYGAMIIILYTASTLYHVFADFKLKSIFQLLDHCSIYLLIAGSYMPFTLPVLDVPQAVTIVSVEWSLALAGILIEVLCSRKLADIISLPIFLAMGWMALVCFQDLYAVLTVPAFTLLCTGGGLYTLGVIFFLMDHVPYMHTVWHVFVLAGTICHWIAVTFFMVLPQN